MEVIKNWMLSIVGTALVSAVAMAVTPEGGVKKVLRMVCGFAAMLAFAGMFMEFDNISFSSYMSQYREAAEEISGDAREKTSVKTRLIIEERCAAYILDKAEEIGANAAATVRAVWNENGFWYPTEAEIYYSGTEETRKKLEYYITAELGIAADKQEWKEYDGRY